MPTDITRRRTLVAAGVAIGLAGCLAGDDDADAGDGGDGTGNTDNVEHDVFDLPPATARPLWAVDEAATGFISLLTADDESLWMVDDPAEIDGLEAWLSETDFGRSNVVSVQSVGQNTCYGMTVRDVAVEDGTIVGSATATDTSDGGGCGQAITYPRALVRVTGDDLPDDASFTVTDGRGNSSEVAADGRLVDPAKLPGRVRPNGDPPKQKSFTCDDEDFQRLERPDGEVAYGEPHDADGNVTFAMRVVGKQPTDADHERDAEFGRGDEVQVQLWNVSTEELVTGNRWKYNLEVLTTDGWQDVRGTTDGEMFGYTDEGILHRPGDGFEWSFELTEAGIVADHPRADRLTVCPDLQPGRYRFVFWEASGQPLAVSFDYTG